MTFDDSRGFLLRFVGGLVVLGATSMVYGVCELVRWLMRSLLIVLLLASSSLAQEVGSAAAARVMADIQNRAIESEIRWNEAKKLAVRPVPMGLKPAKNSMDVATLTKGQVGDLSYWHFTVLSIIDEKNMLLRLGDKTIWLADFPTEGLTDEQAVRLVGPVEVGETKAYESVVGDRTVRVVRFVSADKLAAEEAELHKREEEERKAEEEAKYSTWTSTAGTKIVAKFVSWKAGKIELLTKDGRTIFVTTSQLSPEDGEKARKLLKESRPKK